MENYPGTRCVLDRIWVSDSVKRIRILQTHGRPTDCAAHCSESEECLAWTYWTEDGECDLYSGILDQQLWRETECMSGIRDSTDCPHNDIPAPGKK